MINFYLYRLYVNFLQDPITHRHWFNILFQYDASIPIKMGVMDGMVPSAILALGTDSHYETAEQIQEGEVSTRRNIFQVK